MQNFLNKHISSGEEAKRLKCIVLKGYDLDQNPNLLNGDLPVHYLGAYGSKDTFNLLGEERLKRGNNHGWTAGHYACSMGLFRSAAFLFKQFPSLMQIENADGKVVKK